MSWKKSVLIGAWSLAVIAWLIQIPVFFIISDDKTASLLSLAGAIVMTELAIYATAGLLGLTLIESRKKIWTILKRIVCRQSAPSAKSA